MPDLPIAPQSFRLDLHVRRLFDLSPDAICIDSGGIIVYANAAAARLFGARDAEALVGVSGSSLRDPGSEAAAAERIGRLIDSPGSSMPFVDRRYRRVDGAPVDAEVAAFSYAEDGGVHIVVTLRDATERKSAAHALARSEARFHDFAAASGEWFWETDAQGRYTWFSKEVERVTGFPREWHYGKGRIELAVAAGVDLQQEPWRSHVAALERHEAFRDFRYLRSAPDGLRWVRSSGQPFFDAVGRFLGYRGTGVDISHEVALELQSRKAEERLQHALEGSNLSLWETDLSTGEVYLSAGWAELAGLPRGEVRTTVEALVGFAHPEDMPEIRRISLAVMKGEIAEYETEHRVRMSSGRWKWIRSLGKVSERDVRGKALRMTGTNHDIDQRKLAEIALRESELRYRALFELMPDPIVVTNGRFVLFANSAAVSLSRAVDASQLIGREAMSFVHADSHPAVRDRLACLLAEPGTSVPFMELKYVDTAGGIREVETGAVSFTEAGETRVLLAIRDITERKLVRERVERMNAELEDRVRERTTELQALVKELETFQYAVAHDLHTSLGVMSVNAGMLMTDLGPQLSEHHRRSLRRLEENAQLTARLLDDLLAYSRLGREALHRTTVSMSGQANDISNRLLRAAPERRIYMAVGELPECMGDPRMLAQLWARLLSNAIKFTRTRDPARIEAGFDGSRGAYFVRDNGVGFDMQHAEKLFGVFERLHHDERFEGTGVGLAIAARIVRRHGGTIRAEARPEEGATFWFTVPPGAAVERVRP
jgi:PAS domain S-box-containing protein